MARPRVIVLRAPGTNCDEETVAAWQRVGAEVETWHINRLIESRAELDHFQILTIPGGFSYGDDLEPAASWRRGSGPFSMRRCGDFTIEGV